MINNNGKLKLCINYKRTIQKASNCSNEWWKQSQVYRSIEQLYHKSELCTQRYQIRYNGWFFCSKPNSIIIVTNKVVSPLDFQTIERYVKNTNHIDVDKVEVLRLPQSKSYLKIIGIPYINEKSNVSITVDVVEDIIKYNHTFNNIMVTSKPWIIKVFPKLDIAIIWLDIWDIQSNSNVKGLINRCFNIGRYITMIKGTNMNPRIPQYKNYWK